MRQKRLSAMYLALAVVMVLAGTATLSILVLPGARQTVLNVLPTTWSIALTAWRYGIRVDHGLAWLKILFFF